MLRIFSLLLLPLFTCAQNVRVDRYAQGLHEQSTWFEGERPVLEVFYKNGSIIARTFYTYSDTTLIRKQQWLYNGRDSVLSMSFAKLDERHVRTDYFRTDGTLQEQTLLTLDSAGRTIISDTYFIDEDNKRVHAWRYRFEHSRDSTRCHKTFNDELLYRKPDIPPDLIVKERDTLGRVILEKRIYRENGVWWGERGDMDNFISTDGGTKRIFYSRLHPQRVKKERHGWVFGHTRYRYRLNGKLRKVKFGEFCEFKSCARFDRNGFKKVEWEKVWLEKKSKTRYTTVRLDRK